LKPLMTLKYQVIRIQLL